MNIVQTILDKSIINHNSILNILLVGNEPDSFIEFLKKLKHNCLSYNDIYYGKLNPHIIVCNDRIYNYDLCKKLSILYHVPIITVDHSIKNKLFDDNKLQIINDLPCCTKIAINFPISKSWNSIHDDVIPYDINNNITLETWNNLLISTSKKVFSL